MKTTKITLQLTPDELFDLAYALEAQIKEAVKETDNTNVKDFIEWECENEVKMLRHFMFYHGYTAHTNATENFIDYKDFHQVDEWLNSLMKIELKRRKSIPKE